MECRSRQCANAGPYRCTVPRAVRSRCLFCCSSEAIRFLAGQLLIMERRISLRKLISTAVIACLVLALSTIGGGEAVANDEDRIPDFSYCGYRGAGVSIPDVGAAVTLSPREDGDDTGRIQKAIDRVSDMERNKEGFRGAVLLKAGTYRVAGSLRMRASGVVLRGMGQRDDGTVIIATGNKQRALIRISGGKPGERIKSSRRAIADEYVPVGARKLRLESAEGLEVGDPVVVFRPATEKWIETLGTEHLGWEPGTYDMAYERHITAIGGKEITIDAPIVCAIDARFGGGSVYKTTPDGRISKVGVEKLRLVSEYKNGQKRKDESHAWEGVRIGNLRDGWVRNVTAVHFGYSCVSLKNGATQITVQDCAFLYPVSRITGGRRYSFNMDGQLCLVQRCYSSGGRHDFVMHSRARGPNVFLDCVADRTYDDSGPHHRWATGTLYDNVCCEQLFMRWRDDYGSGHGWPGANTVFWNCRAHHIICQKPPTAHSWCIGCTGHIRGNGQIKSRCEPVVPRSLYLKQLEDRLGAQAVKNVTTKNQRRGHIRPAELPTWPEGGVPHEYHTMDLILRRKLAR